MLQVEHEGGERPPGEARHEVDPQPTERAAVAEEHVHHHRAEGDGRVERAARDRARLVRARQQEKADGEAVELKVSRFTPSDISAEFPVRYDPAYLASNSYLQANDPQIAALAKRLVRGEKRRAGGSLIEAAASSS